MSVHGRQQQQQLYLHLNRPFPSYLVPLFQSESKCETILMKMTLIFMKMKLHAELIFIWKVSHLDSFWNRGTRELGNGLFNCFSCAYAYAYAFMLMLMRKWELHKTIMWIRSSYVSAYACAYAAGVLTCLCLCYAYACAYAYTLVKTSL